MIGDEMMKSTSLLKNGICGVLCLLMAMGGVVSAAVILDPNSPQTNFEKDGNQAVTTGPSLLLNDGSTNDHVGFFAADPDAASGKEVEVATTFRVLNNTTPAGVDTGLRIIITDGAATPAIASSVTLGGIPGIAIAIGTDFNSPASYAGFVSVDWLAPVTLRFRRTAAGDAEIV